MRDAVLASAPTTEVCVARKRARGPESRRSRRHACRALCHAFVGVSAACRARFCCVLAPVFCLYLRVTALVLQATSRGVAVGCLVWVLRVSGANTEICCRLHGSNREIHGSTPRKRVSRLNDLQTQIFTISAFPELADIGRRSKSIRGRMP